MNKINKEKMYLRKVLRECEITIQKKMIQMNKEKMHQRKGSKRKENNSIEKEYSH